MKSTILLLAAMAGITIAVQASANDQPILSCITELTANGDEVRDCEQEAQLVLDEPDQRDEPVPGAAPAAMAHDGGPKQDRPDTRR